MLQIVVPMAGAGSRFRAVGYTEPKPLIPVLGVPMIRLVIENLRPARPHRFTFICQEAHLHEHGLAGKLAEWAPGSNVVTVPGLTQGAACTVLAARDCIDHDDPLMIANSDQFVEVDVERYLAALDKPGVDGLIMTMTADDPKWSFASVDERGNVTRVVEKEVISREATVGIYNFRRGCDFVGAAASMIAKDLRVNDEFYVAPVYNELIAQGATVNVFNIGNDAERMHGLGTPADLEAFLALPLAAQVTANVR